MLRRTKVVAPLVVHSKRGGYAQTFNTEAKMGKAQAFNESNFEADVIGSNLPVLVDFWATWCGPCHAVAPLVEEAAGEFEGRAKVGKVDVDANQGLAERYGIRAIPTMLFFKGGEVVDRIVGMPSGKSAITDKLEGML